MYTSFKRVPLGLTAVALGLAVAACAGTTSATTMTTDMDEMGSEFAFGEPADPAEADRTIEIVASDDLTFDPADVTVSPGEVITFQVVNDGQIPHDFTLGDEATQEEHEEEMSEMEDMDHEDPNTIDMAAGETMELTWRFGDSGTVIFGCHEPGHYAGGMRGQITVEQ